MIEKTILKPEERAILALRALYRQHGYLPYKMSKFEEYEYYIRNKDFLVSDRVITFTDTSGRLLALKPDVTLSIIKSVTDLPGIKHRVCYNESIYRVSESTGQFKEITQTGLECIGDIDLYDIFENLSLAARSLSMICGDFILQISHMGILSALLEDASQDSAFRQQALEYIGSKNAHDLHRLCLETGVEEKSAALLAQITTLSGPREEVLARLEDMDCPGIRKPLEELKALSAMLSGTPESRSIIFDFSVVNNMNYYSGIVFRGFLSGISEGVLAGGQYDRLMEKLGRKSGAIGFAIYLNLLEQLPAPAAKFDVDTLVVYESAARMQEAAVLAARLIQEGKSVSVQRAIPPKLRYRQLIRICEEVAPC